MSFTCWLIRDDFRTLRYYDYLLLVGAALALYFFFYCIGWLLMKYDIHNWEKDVRFGKCRLTTVIINRDKTEYGEYLTFAGPVKKDKIRIQVQEADYKQYEIGINTIVTYLKYSKEALRIVKL